MVKQLLQIGLSTGKTLTFKDDITIRELDALGDEPKQGSPTKEVELYNRKKICAFAVDPLTLEELADLPSIDYYKIFKAVIIDYNTKVVNFLRPTPKDSLT